MIYYVITRVSIFLQSGAPSSARAEKQTIGSPKLLAGGGDGGWREWGLVNRVCCVCNKKTQKSNNAQHKFFTGCASLGVHLLGEDVSPHLVVTCKMHEELSNQDSATFVVLLLSVCLGSTSMIHRRQDGSGSEPTVFAICFSELFPEHVCLCIRLRTCNQSCSDICQTTRLVRASTSLRSGRMHISSGVSPSRSSKLGSEALSQYRSGMRRTHQWLSTCPLSNRFPPQNGSSR